MFDGHSMLAFNKHLYPSRLVTGWNDYIDAWYLTNGDNAEWDKETRDVSDAIDQYLDDVSKCRNEGYSCEFHGRFSGPKHCAQDISDSAYPIMDELNILRIKVGLPEVKF